MATMSYDQDRSGYDSSNQSRTLDTSYGNDFRGNPSGGSPYGDDTSRRLEAALHAPAGIDKLLLRLKQSIYSTRELSGFLKERCALEDRHAQGYKKLVRHTIETLRRTDARQGTYSRHLTETLQVNERLAENGLAFASALHTMSEELRDVAENAERGRKQWKHTTTDAEKRLVDAETAQQRAKEKYTSAADQYEKARTGERQGGMFGLKNKSPAQQEEALKEKADSLDSDYAARSEAAQTHRREFEDTTRPRIVRALKDIIEECDAAVAMQMAKLASVSEKHVVANGMVIAPFKTPGSDLEPRGLRQIARDVDDRRDFSDFMLDGVEPPSQFKGRSRRNTDAELINTPTPRTENIETPYNPSQSHVESRPPQLPQIGGSEAFGRSFEADRPTPQNNRNSYLGGQSDALGSHPTRQPQQTGVINDPVSSFPSSRAPIGPSLPSYDRGQASPSDNFNTNNGNNGFGRGQGPPRQETMPTAVGRGRPSMDASPYDRNQGPIRQDTMPTFGGRGLPTSTDSYNDRNQGPPRQATMPTFPDREQSAGVDTYSDRNQGPVRQGTMPTLAGRGEPVMPGGFPHTNQGPTRQETLPAVGSGRASMDGSRPWQQGNGRPDSVPPFAGRGQPGPTTSAIDRTQGPLRQDTAPSAGLRDQLPLGRENPYVGNNQDPVSSTPGREQLPLGRENPYVGNSQDLTPSAMGGRNQPMVGRENPYIGNKQESAPPMTGRDQLPTGRENPYMGNNQDLNRGLAQGASTTGSYVNPSTSQGPVEGPGFGRGQGPQGVLPAGRGGPIANRANLPSQQQQQQAPPPQQVQRPILPPTRPVFGMHLDELFRRDGSAVPVIVFQCIQAVDTFGLSTQGIYRVSGSSPTVQQLKSEFDHDSNKVDLTDRSVFNNDIVTVATLLKNFLRDLPDPLLTGTAYQSFIQAAKYENSIMRRDALHQHINSLPDANYATLRVLTLHLHRVSMNSEANKMDMRNLAIVFGPTVMGGNVSDTGLQTKVMETILQHTHDIFDPDEENAE